MSWIFWRGDQDRHGSLSHESWSINQQTKTAVCSGYQVQVKCLHSNSIMLVFIDAKGQCTFCSRADTDR